MTVIKQTFIIFLVIIANSGVHTMSDWSVVVPEATINYVLNPSIEISSNYASLAGGTAVRSSNQSYFGHYSLSMITNNDNEGGSVTLSALTNAIHYATVRVKGTLPTAWDWSLDDSTYTAPTSLMELDSDWTLYGAPFPAAQANGATALYIRQDGSGTGVFGLDGFQVEQKDGYWTTFCAGSRDGCEWNGAVNASTSTRSAYSRAGGRVKDLKDDYYFGVIEEVGAGATPRTLGVDSYATLPGGELNSVSYPPRPFTLVGWLRPDDGTCDLNTARQNLQAVLLQEAYPDQNGVPQPVRLWYTGATVTKQIAAHYEGGLGGKIGFDNLIHEKFALRFIATDPFWYEIGDSEVVLDYEDKTTTHFMAARTRSTGQWGNLDMGSINTASQVDAVVVAPDKSIYYGGNFTGWDGVVNRDYMAKYTPSSGTWITPDPPDPLDDRVRALAVGPDGKIYVGGDFGQVGSGGTETAYLAVYDPATDLFDQVGSPNTGATITSVNALAFDREGALLVGGNFRNWAGVAAADRFAKWTPSTSTWSAVGSGGTGVVEAIVVDKSNNYYIGGSFVNWAGTAPADHLAMWDGTQWLGVGGGGWGPVEALAIDNSDLLYVLGGTLVDFAATWNGSRKNTLGSGLNDQGYSIAIAPDGFVYIGGTFTTAGGLSVADRVARWNGASFAHLDIDLPGSPAVYTVAIGATDPLNDSNYDVHLGFSTTGSSAHAGSTTVTNDGTTEVYPIFTVKRTGGTVARLQTLRNETLGLELMFDYLLQDGETLTVDLRPTKKTVESSFYGRRWDAALISSSLGQWRLAKGANNVTCFVSSTGTPVIDAHLLWNDAYTGYD